MFSATEFSFLQENRKLKIYYRCSMKVFGVGTYLQSEKALTCSGLANCKLGPDGQALQTLGVDDANSFLTDFTLHKIWIKALLLTLT